MSVMTEILQEIQTALDMAQKTAHPALLLLHSLIRIQEMVKKEEQNAAATTSCSNGCTCNHHTNLNIPQQSLSLKEALDAYPAELCELLTQREIDILSRRAKGEKMETVAKEYSVTKVRIQQMEKKAIKKIQLLLNLTGTRLVEKSDISNSNSNERSN